MKILIIDDSKNIRKALKKSFSLIPQLDSVLEENDVQEGVDSITKNKPDIVVLDLMLKTGTGLDLLKSIQNFEVKPFIILYSNFLDAEYIASAKKFGVNAFFDKADNILKLVDIIKNHVT